MPTAPSAIRATAPARHAFGLTLLAIAGAVAPARAQTPEPAPVAPCHQLSSTVLMLDGPTDAAMRDCVRAALAPTTAEVVVRSGGGDVEAAMDIADALHRPGLVVRVRDRCYSSCANYFLPIATTLVVEPGATIVVHGGIDPQFVAEEHVARRAELIRERGGLRPDLSDAELESDFDRSVEKFAGLVERQRDFAARHRVGLGWFLYREPGDREFGRHLAGRAGARPSLFGWRYLLVEEPMLRSCLPRVQAQAFQKTLQETFIGDRKRFARFIDAKGRRSLELRCVSEPPREDASATRVARPGHVGIG